MSGYQQRWRNVYPNGSFLRRGGAAVRPRQMIVNFHCQVSTGIPPLRVAQMVQSTCSSELLLRSCLCSAHIPLNWHAAYAWVLWQEATVLCKMLPSSHRSYLGQHVKVALLHLLCSISGESQISLRYSLILYLLLTALRSFEREPSASRIVGGNLSDNRRPPRALKGLFPSLKF